MKGEIHSQPQPGDHSSVDGVLFNVSHDFLHPFVSIIDFLQLGFVVHVVGDVGEKCFVLALTWL